MSKYSTLQSQVTGHGDSLPLIPIGMYALSMYIHLIGILPSILTDEGFDAVGWDIRKTLQLYRKTNPTMLEWLKSR